jgi:hypothetical protein
MSKRKFTLEQISELLKNANVVKCSEKSITYSTEFKVWAVKRYDEGLTASQIFKESGFDLLMIGADNPDCRLGDWRKIYNASGANGLIFEARGRSKAGGRPKAKGLTDADRIKRLEIENAYLKAENDFLAKLRAAKKR